MPAERWFRIGLGVGTLAVVALEVLSLSSLQSSLWGLHAAAFLPRGLVMWLWRRRRRRLRNDSARLLRLHLSLLNLCQCCAN